MRVNTQINKYYAPYPFVLVVLRRSV